MSLKRRFRRLLRVALMRPGPVAGSHRRSLDTERDATLAERQQSLEDQEDDLAKGLAEAEDELRDRGDRVVHIRALAVEGGLLLVGAVLAMGVDFAANVVTGFHFAGIEVTDLGAANSFQYYAAFTMTFAIVAGGVLAAAGVTMERLAWKALTGVALVLLALLGGADRAGAIVTLDGGLLNREHLNLVILGCHVLVALLVPALGAFLLDRAYQAWTIIVRDRSELRPLEERVRALAARLERVQTAGVRVRDERVQLREDWDDAEAVASADDAEDVVEPEAAPTPEGAPPSARPPFIDVTPVAVGHRSQAATAAARRPAHDIIDTPSSYDTLSALVLMASVGVVGFCLLFLGGCAPSAAPRPLAHVVIIRDDTARLTGPGSTAGPGEAGEVEAVTSALLAEHLPFGSSVTLLVPGLGTAPAHIRTLSLAPSGASGDPRSVRMQFEADLQALARDEVPKELIGSTLFAAVSTALREAPARPTAIIIASDLREVSRYGSRRLNFESKDPLPDLKSLTGHLEREHLLPDLAGIPVTLCGLDPMVPPKTTDALVALFTGVLAASGSPSVEVHTHCGADGAVARRLP